MPALLIKTLFFSIVHYDSGAEQQMKRIIIQRFTDTVVWETMWYRAFVVQNQSTVTASSDVFWFILSLPAHCCEIPDINTCQVTIHKNASDWAKV